MQTLQIIKEMGQRQRAENYLINCGDLNDIIISESEMLRKRELKYLKSKDRKFLAEYIKGRRHGLAECIKLLAKVWKCQNPVDLLDFIKET